jgi:hypothetical protein
MRCDNVDFVVALVGHTKLLVRCQLAFKLFFTDWLDDGLFHVELGVERLDLKVIGL